MKTREGRRLLTSVTFLYITKQWKTKRVRYDLQRAARILQDDIRQNECVTIYRERCISQKQSNDKISALLQQTM